MDIVIILAESYKVDIDSILESRKGLKVENKPRKIAMYLCQQLTGKSQKEFAKYFNLKSTGSVSYTIHMIRSNIRENKNFAKEVNSLIKVVIRKVV